MKARLALVTMVAGVCLLTLTSCSTEAPVGTPATGRSSSSVVPQTTSPSPSPETSSVVSSPATNARLTSKVKQTSILQLTSFLNDWRTEGAFKAASKYLAGDERPTSPSGLPVLVSGQVKSSEVVTLVSEDQFTVMVVLDLKFSGDPVAWGQGANTRFVTFTRTSPTSPYLMYLATGP